MKKHVSAKGRVIDMTAMAKQHENERAVSNVPINAKGDIIDSRGKVKVSREDVKKEFYKNSVPGIEEKLAIKDDEQKVDVPSEPAKPAEDENVVTRTLRKRKNGTEYYEIEYKDGSMEEVDK